MLLLYINVIALLDTAIIDLSTDVSGDGMAYVSLSRLRTLNGLHLLSFDSLSVKVSNPCINEINRLRNKFRKDLPQIKKSKETKRKIRVTVIIEDGEPCSKKAKVSVINVQGTSNITVSSNERKSTHLEKSNGPKKSKICDNNSLNKPCTQKRKVDIDSSAYNSALALPRPQTDDKLIASINLKHLTTKFNVKDKDSCSSLIVSKKLSNIECKPKNNKTKSVVQNNHHSSGLIVSIKLSSIKLKTSNPKKMMSSLLMKSLPIQIMLGGDKGIRFITLLMKMFKECGVRY
uniref:Uncharacterized protein n=1 Tax=Amphimedon queenslandica TaxID=400682 RepID=A0A1X7TS81_AMPQE